MDLLWWACGLGNGWHCLASTLLSHLMKQFHSFFCEKWSTHYEWDRISEERKKSTNQIEININKTLITPIVEVLSVMQNGQSAMSCRKQGKARRKKLSKILWCEKQCHGHKQSIHWYGCILETQPNWDNTILFQWSYRKKNWDTTNQKKKPIIVWRDK